MYEICLANAFLTSATLSLADDCIGPFINGFANSFLLLPNVKNISFNDKIVDFLTCDSESCNNFIYNTFTCSLTLSLSENLHILYNSSLKCLRTLHESFSTAALINCGTISCFFRLQFFQQFSM